MGKRQSLQQKVLRKLERNKQNNETDRTWLVPYCGPGALPDMRATAKTKQAEGSALTVRHRSGGGRKRKDDLNRGRLPLFRQGGATVGLRTRLSAERDQGGSIFIGRFVQAIRETFIRQDVLGLL